VGPVGPQFIVHDTKACQDFAVSSRNGTNSRLLLALPPPTAIEAHTSCKLGITLWTPSVALSSTRANSQLIGGEKVMCQISTSLGASEPILVTIGDEILNVLHI